MQCRSRSTCSNSLSKQNSNSSKLRTKLLTWKSAAMWVLFRWLQTRQDKDHPTMWKRKITQCLNLSFKNNLLLSMKELVSMDIRVSKAKITSKFHRNHYLNRTAARGRVESPKKKRLSIILTVEVPLRLRLTERSSRILLTFVKLLTPTREELASTWRLMDSLRGMRIIDHIQVLLLTISITSIHLTNSNSNNRSNRWSTEKSMHNMRATKDLFHQAINQDSNTKHNSLPPSHIKQRISQQKTIWNQLVIKVFNLSHLLTRELTTNLISRRSLQLLMRTLLIRRAPILPTYNPQQMHTAANTLSNSHKPATISMRRRISTGLQIGSSTISRPRKHLLQSKTPINLPNNLSRRLLPRKQPRHSKRQRALR